MRCTFLLPFALTAFPALAQTMAPPTAEDADFAVMVDILRANDCALPAMAIMEADPADSLTLDRMRALGQFVTLNVVAGNLEVRDEGSTLALSDAACAGEALLPTARDRMRDMLFGNACVMDKEAAYAAMAEMGSDADEIDFVMQTLFRFDEVVERIGVTITVGDTTTPADATALVLKNPACPEEPEAPAADPGDVRARLIQMLADSGCDMTIDEARAVIGDYGLEIGQIVATVGPMIAAGEAVEVDGLLTLSPAVCATAGQ